MATWPGDRDRAGIHDSCRCPPRLAAAGCQRTTGGLHDSDEGPGAGGADAALRRAMQWPRFQMSRAAEELLCFMACANFAKLARHHSPRPESHSDAMARLGVTQARLAQHVELTVTRVTRHAQRPLAGPAHSPRIMSSGPPYITLHSCGTARFARSNPSNSQRPAINRRGRSPLALRSLYLQWAVTVVTRCGLPSLAAARLNRRCPVTSSSPSHSDGAAARLRLPQPASLTL